MKRASLIVVTLLFVLLLSACGVEDRRYTYTRYIGNYNNNLYFMVSDSTDTKTSHLYRFEGESFEYVKEFSSGFVSYFGDGLLFSTTYDHQNNRVIREYNVETDETKFYDLPEMSVFSRIVAYHDGVLMFFTAALQRLGDEELTLYSTTTETVLTNITDVELDVGYGVADFDQHYIYVTSERTHSEDTFKGYRINRDTNAVDRFLSNKQYLTYDSDMSQIFYVRNLSDYNMAFEHNTSLSTEFLTMYNNASYLLYKDETTDTYIFSSNEHKEVYLYHSGDFTTYDVVFNDYSFGFINDSVYYTVDKEEYGSFYKREVAIINIRSIEDNKILYSSDKITISNQNKWEEH